MLRQKLEQTQQVICVMQFLQNLHVGLYAYKNQDIFYKPCQDQVKKFNETLTTMNGGDVPDPEPGGTLTPSGDGGVKAEKLLLPEDEGWDAGVAYTKIYKNMI